MTLTKRGERVAIIAFIAFMIIVMGIVGRVEADTQCATFQANNDYQSALVAGCSFDPLPNGEYPYTWEAN
jgi:steroid 5-alpha reductase family enzyme